MQQSGSATPYGIDLSGRCAHKGRKYLNYYKYMFADAGEVETTSEIATLIHAYF